VALDGWAETARFFAYRAAWRHAPALLRQIERVGHGLRNRELGVYELGAGQLRATLASSDERFVREVARWLGGCMRSEPTLQMSTRVRSLDATASWAKSRAADLVLVEVPEWRAQIFTAQGFVLLPKRVGHIERLAGEDCPFARRVRRSVERLRLSLVPSRSEADLERFYFELYLPMVERRHADRGRPTSLTLLRALLRESWLLKVMDGDSWPSGAIVTPHPLWPDCLSIAVVGVRGGDYDAVAEPVRVAPVLLARDFARRGGFRRCDHLVTRPFLADGLFKRKRRWRGELYDMSERPDRVVLSALHDTPAVRRVLGSGFIALEAGRLAAVACGDVAPDAARELTRLTTHSWRPFRG
jgi:hypothetical protein